MIYNSNGGMLRDMLRFGYTICLAITHDVQHCSLNAPLPFGLPT